MSIGPAHMDLFTCEECGEDLEFCQCMHYDDGDEEDRWLWDDEDEDEFFNDFLQDEFDEEFEMDEWE